MPQQGLFMRSVQWIEQHLLPCPSKTWLHIDCPGCGLQRSLVALMKGDFALSWQLYPATVPLLLMLCYLVLHLRFQFKNGARNLLILFSGNTVLILVNYFYKMYTGTLFL